MHADRLPLRAVAAADEGGASAAESAARASVLQGESSARREALQHRRDSICAVQRQRAPSGFLKPIAGASDCPESVRWSDLATDSPRSSAGDGGGGDSTPPKDAGVRIGLRASPSDLSPMLGFSLGKVPFEFTMEYWLRFGYYDVTVEIEPHHRAHYKEFRHGIVLGCRYDFGGREVGVVPGAGLEWVGGDYAGLELAPEPEVLPWAGLSLRLPRRNFFGIRIMAGEGVLGWFRIEWAKDFR